MGADSGSRRARVLAGALEAFAAQIYFAPEAHAEYVALGFAGSPGRVRGVAMPDGPAYFCSRGALLGQVGGEVVASAFAVFNPAVVVPAVAHGWSLTTAEEIAAARDRGALAQLRRILGPEPEGAVELAAILGPAAAALPVAGRPLYAGLLARVVPDDPLGAAWRHADRLREFRGDAHTSAWTSAGFSAVEIGLLTESYWGLPVKSYSRSRGWADADLDAGLRTLQHRGLVADGALTDEGRRTREAIEVCTDEQCLPLLEGMADGFDTAVGLLRSYSEAVRAADGYPAAGPHDLAAASG